MIYYKILCEAKEPPQCGLFCSHNLTNRVSLHMGVWKGNGLEVKESMRMDAKPCGHLNVYVSGRLDVHHPCDPPCRRGLAVVMARFLFAQNPTKGWYKSFYPSASPSAASPSASQILFVPFSFTYFLLAFGCFLRRLFASPCG